MNADTTLAHLIRLHEEIEADSGCDTAGISADTSPLDMLSGFDSLLIPNVIRGLATAMGVPLPKGKRLRNCYTDVRGVKLTLRGVSERFCELYGQEGKMT